MNVWCCNTGEASTESHDQWTTLLTKVLDKSAFGEDVEDFRPERFLDSEKTSGREHATYGYGKSCRAPNVLRYCKD